MFLFGVGSKAPHFILLFVGGVLSLGDTGHTSSNFVGASVSCNQIVEAISSASTVFQPGSAGFSIDVSHYVTSSEDSSTCSVEPGNVDDVGKILHILGRNRTPFAVKGGGHAMNPGFSSTPGVQISMSRFSEIKYDATMQTVSVGAGCIWDDVYAALEPHNVVAVGGRVRGIGVAGFTLGGGYSWLSNEYGLAIDNVLALDLVTPDGRPVTVARETNPDLFFALKGGFNNFGIVTRFVLKTFPQGEVWGGFMVVAEGYINEANAAIVKFTSTVKDPRAAIIASHVFVLGALPSVAAFALFYNGPHPPEGIFDDILAVPASTTNISTRSFLSLIQSGPVTTTTGLRGVYHTISNTDYTKEFLDAVVNETQFWGNKLSFDPAITFGYSMEPFLPSAFSKATADSSAYPPTRDLLFPLSISWVWALNSSDNQMFNSIRQSALHLKKVAEAQGQNIGGLSVYGNYAIFGTPLEEIYGGHLGRLRTIKRRFDPENIMGLAGGWKL